MNVLYFSSDLFVSVAATSMLSLMENNKSFSQIHFYIIDDGISEDNKNKLSKMVYQYNHEISYISAPDPSEAFKFNFKSRYQMGHSYMRMCIGSLLPSTVKKVLCFDSDTLVLGDLSELWNTNMGENILAGVTDCLNLEAYKKQFGLKGEEFYCNAGVFLINLDLWRKESIEDIISKIINHKNGNIFFFEQTLMNYVCRGRVLMLHPRYNAYTLFYAFTYKNLIKWRKPTIFYKKCEIKEAICKPIIIHFTRNFYMMSRPWVEGCDHPLTARYLEYKKKTPWKKVEADTRTCIQRFKYKLLHSVSQGLIAGLASILYNNVRPKIWWKNE